MYSASEFASHELPELDVSLRGAVSIARRLQDPLAELVKIDPKSIGVGQYQHDVSQYELARSLDTVVEDCVNAVGVDVNTASVPLLTRVSGLGNSVAQAIVAHRDARGRFASRAQLRDVPRLGEKTFEQAAGFLRIMDGDDPLDASAVHPESYPLVQRILADLRQDLKAVIGNGSLLKSLDPSKYTDAQFGLPTISDILRELEKPGRDPRPEFTTATFREGVETLADLRPDMILEGVVTNVAAFGAFVDIGVHQDGLVHISALSNTFVKDPHSVVKAGQIVKVKVLEADVKRKRIALTMRLNDAAEKPANRPDARAQAARFIPAGQSSGRETEACARCSASGWCHGGGVPEVEGMRPVCRREGSGLTCFPVFLRGLSPDFVGEAHFHTRAAARTHRQAKLPGGIAANVAMPVTRFQNRAAGFVTITTRRKRSICPRPGRPACCGQNGAP